MGFVQQLSSEIPLAEHTRAIAWSKSDALLTSFAEHAAKTSRSRPINQVSAVAAASWFEGKRERSSQSVA
jgi:hypothetical protein